MKAEQNFKNHSRISPFYHGFIFCLVLVAIIGSIVKLYRNWVSGDGGLLTPFLFCLLTLLITLVAFIARSFALKAQDRAIRAEESLRYYAITGELPDNTLSLGQVVALRFAPNNEVVELTHRAVKENLSVKDIKMAIKNWKGDYNRV